MMHMEQMEDDILILLREHNIRALDLIYRRYYLSLVNFGVRNLGDFSLAEDLAQDILIAFWQTNPVIDSIVGLERYLFTSLINRIARYHKRSRKNREMLEKMNIPLVTDADYEKELTYSMLIALLAKQFNQLTKSERRIARLLMQKNFSTGEVARALKTSSQNVSTLKARLIKRLRSIFERLHLMPVIPEVLGVATLFYSFAALTHNQALAAIGLIV